MAQHTRQTTDYKHMDSYIGLILCFMGLFAVFGFKKPKYQYPPRSARWFKRESDHWWTDRRMDRRYQTYYLPSFAVDTYWSTP